MLELESPRWAMLKASCGGGGEFARALICQIRGGDESAYAELEQQANHQFTLGEVAYAVVPHLVDLAGSSAVETRVWPLSIIGAVAASRLWHPSTSPPIPDDLRDAYDQAMERAAQLTAEALQTRDWKKHDSRQLIAAMAAFHEHRDLAMFLFLSGIELSCPECGEHIHFEESE